MAVYLAQAETLLKQILTLDLNNCSIDVCIASGEPDKPPYEFRHIEQSRKVDQRFREAIEESLKDYRERLDEEHNFELNEFAADTTKADQEIEYLNILPYDSIKEQIKPVEDYLGLGRFEHKDQEFIKKIRFYIIRVQAPQGPAIYFYRHYLPSQILSRSHLFAAFLQDDLYDDLDKPTFLFDRHIDCISCEEHMFILQKHNFFQIFNIKELEKVAGEILEKLEKKNIIHNFQRFKQDCMKDKIKILKLRNIAISGYLDTLTFDALEKNVKRYKLPIQIDILPAENKKKLVYNPKERWAILHLLDDTYNESLMTGNSYQVKGKRILRKK